jgi:hypothetical protein
VIFSQSRKAKKIVSWRDKFFAKKNLASQRLGESNFLAKTQRRKAKKIATWRDKFFAKENLASQRLGESNFLA